MDVMLEIRSKLMAFLPNNWTPLITNCSEIACVLISSQSVPSLQRSVIFNVNGDVTVNVHGQRISSNSYLKDVQPPLPFHEEGVNYFVDRAISIVLKVRLMEVCAGVDSEKYTPAWEHCLHAGKIDTNPFNEIRYSETFRSHKCALLVPSSKWRCVHCTANVKVLRRKCEVLEKAGRRSNKTANVYLTEEEMLEKLNQQKKKIDAQDHTIRRLRERMRELIEKEGKEIDNEVSKDLMDVLRDAKLTPAQSMFVQQQVKMSQYRNKCSMKWHPAIIRLAISLLEASRSSYERLRDSGFVALPSARTLYDYTHFTEVKEGFDHVAIESVCVRVEKLPEKRKYHVVMADEIYVSKNLVYKKASGELIGYTNLNNVDKELETLDQYFKDGTASVKKEQATKIMAFLVKGVANDVKEVVASFAVTNVSPRQMYQWAWRLISALERSGVYITAFICDGCPINRAFIKMHEPSHPFRPSGVVYATVNKAAPHRNLFFISDVPHLLKTLRNSFYRSRLGKRGKRCMMKNGQRIVWDHIIKLYNSEKKRILRKSFKLTLQHVFPDSYSCMKVAPAAQVMSKTVANDLRSQNWPGTSETVTFIEKCNDWFDDLNGAHSSAGRKKRNKRLEPYTSTDDWRFQEIMDFVDYFHEWREAAKTSAGNVSGVSVMSACEGEADNSALLDNILEDNDDEYDDDTPAAKRLPAGQTILGIEMSTYGIMGAIKFILDKENGAGLDFVNPRVFCQDPLEQYFSKQRAGCGGSTNPNVAQFLNKARTIHVSGQCSIKRRGNTEVHADTISLSSEPLRKKKRSRIEIET